MAVAVYLWPAGAVQADNGGTAQVGAVPNVEQVRSSFASAGFQVDLAHNWDWTSPPTSTFQVHDRARGRVVMALVYPTSMAAQNVRVQAYAHEQQQNLRSGALSGYGPHVVMGYGQSFWRANVALVQSTQSELDRVFQLQSDCDTGVAVDANVMNEAGPVGNPVDLDFQQALDNGVVELA
jgi:hypothetical protein